MALPVKLENELLELSEDSGVKLRYQGVDLPSFWIQASRKYSSFSEGAIGFLLSFATMYLCESDFSTVTVTKSKG